MNQILSNELNLFAQELRACLSPAVLKDIAKRVGFVKRKSKYQAGELIALYVWLSQEVGSTSLIQLSSRLEASTGVSMSAEGLNQCFNQTAVAYLRDVFRTLLAQKLCANQSLPDTLMSRFKRIRILDATVFQLPDALARDYQGSGGSSNTAGVKIQLEYDLLSGQFLNVHVGPGKNNDKTYGTTCLQTVEAGDLCLRDLGYFDLGDLQAIHEKKAYYISRLKFNTRIYIKNPAPEMFKNGTLKNTPNIFNSIWHNYWKGLHLVKRSKSRRHILVIRKSCQHVSSFIA